ncbi:GNAT family N-acetyltransferase [Vibrio sonorensis]|uniref:GNAT family N-acetyltransferase n=1 Tax=Vibrio sonorensis TaxID=1004316 RepID=UPI0008DB0ED6|nr:GNAT family N-acetyltransferase [Vibrio sonorensis]
MIINASIVLTPLCLKHAPELFQCVDSSRDNLSLSMPWEKQVISIDSAERYITRRISQKDNGAQWFAILNHGAFCGVFGIKHIDNRAKACELGYWLSDSACGQGIIHKILDVILPVLKKKYGIRCVEFHCLETNLPSIKLLEKVGAKQLQKVTNTMDVPNPNQWLYIYQLLL